MMIESTQNVNVVEKSFKINKKNDIMEIDNKFNQNEIKGVIKY